MIKGILFDLDGVLVDSMPFHLKAWQWVFVEKGIDVDIRTLALNEGRRSAEMAQTISENAGITFNEIEIQDIVAKKRAYYRQIADIKFSPNALETIQQIRQRNKICAIVTSCNRKSLQTAIPKHKMDFFDYIITGEDIARGKPEPDPFLAARDKLGLSSQECVVVENAPLGIQAAKAAGMRCIAITSTLNKEDLIGADFIVDDISNIIPIIDSI